MGTTVCYDVWDEDKVVLENVTSREIQQHFGTDYLYMSYFTGGKAYYLGKYLLSRHGAGRPEPPKRRQKETVVANMPEEWKEEWIRVCSRLRRETKKNMQQA